MSLPFIRRLYFFIPLLIFISQLNAQTYTLNAGSNNTFINTCSGTFYDSGGALSSYGNNEFFTITFCSSTPGAEIAFDLLLLLLKQAGTN